ncbi:hypothetical protein PVAND_000030 [Polypedilum vanderplanki]|uniref:Uncharacterized protein n=1 Tax=Polypedilum vanderplanki TaxID=319348 RepID=A0A9J6BJ66_POLVA|nr:hypothetical protein PVAND_000030 [Polypedilum vanderplanki]
MEEIDKALLKYDFDTTSCTQRAICWYVKESLANIEEQKASTFDYLINNLSSSDWIEKLLTNTAWNSAISAGKQGLNCESTFYSCKLSPSNLENFANKLMQFARRK